MNARGVRVGFGAVAIAVLILAHSAAGQDAATGRLNSDPTTDPWRQARLAIAGGAFLPLHSTGARLKRSATRRLGKDIIWGADTLFIGLTVDSFWDVTTVVVIYRFLALENQEWDIGLDAGLYVAGFSAGFRRDRLQLL